MASKKIQGITIQFGADTSPLNKALKDSEKTSASLNKELGQVNKLLKFDPGNTQLLAQKQKILAESIENTETKLGALKQAQGEVEKMFKNGDIGEKEYREFQRTLAETEQSLKSYTTQMDRMQVEQEKLQSSTKQLNTLLDATGKSLDDFQDVLGNRLTNALRNGTANSDDLTVAINKIGKAALGADADLSEMRNALNRIDDDGIDEVRKSLGQLESSSDGAEESLNGIGKGVAAGNLMEAGQIVADLGGKVIELGKNAQETALQFQDSTASIKSALGLTDGEAEKAGEVIRNVFESGVTDSVEEATQAVTLTKQAFEDLNDTDLSEVTRQIMSIAGTTGTDVQENTNAAKKVMQNFGLSAQGSLDLIAAGYQNGLNSQNDFLDTLNEYAPYFSQAGMSANEFMQILNNGMEAGAFNTDKVADSVKEFQIMLGDGRFEASLDSYSQSTRDMFQQWNEGKATTKDVFDSVGDDLRNMPIEDRQAALSNLNTMFEDLGIDATLALFDIGNEFDNVSGKAADMASQTPGEKMQGDLNKLKEAFEPIGKDIQEALSPVLEFLAELSEMFAELPEMFAELPGPVRTFIEVVAGIGALVAVLLPVIATFAALGGALSLMEISLLPIIGIVAAVAAAIAVIIVVIKNWGAITDWLTDKWQTFTDWLSGIWEGISQTASDVWNSIIDFFKSVWDTIYGIFEVPLNLIKSIVEGVFYAIYAVIYTTWEVIKFALKSAWDWISGKASAIFTPIAQFFSTTWNGIKDTVSSVWTSIKDTLGGIWDGIKNKATEVFSSVWNYIKDGFNSLKDTLGGIVKGIANGIIEPIGNAINGVISGVNWILEKVGSKKHFDPWNIEAHKFAKGTGGLQKDTIGIVNDQKGSTYKELIVPPKGSPFIAEGRDVVLPMEKGTKIMPANQTKSFLETLPHFASGIGDFFGGVWESISSFTGNIWDYISHPTKIVQMALDKFTDLSGIVEPWLSVATGAVSSVYEGVVDFIKGIFDTQSNVNYNPSAGTEQWRGLAEKALRMTGQYSEANLTRLLYQMQTESGGNPNAINNWDINAQNGIPSKGLMQVIDPTFRAYAMSGYDSNIWDPLSNMLASIRYAVSRYGSLAAAYRGTGYEDGIGDIGLSDIFPSIPELDVRWFKDGGILTKPALFNIGNGRVGGAGEAGPEAIAPIDKMKDLFLGAALEFFGDKDINITLNLAMVTDGREWAKQTVPYTQSLINDKEKLMDMINKGVRR
jgi:phage-related minor tail protein